MALPNLLLIPGLLCSPRLFDAQKTTLAAHATVKIADHTRSSTMAELAKTILDEAPDRFSLAGLSMGGYIALEIMCQQPGRVERLALLDTKANLDTPEIRESRLKLIEFAQLEGVVAAQESLLPRLVRLDRVEEEPLRTQVLRMAEETGLPAFLRQMQAILDRRDYLEILDRINCPTLVAVGDQDILTPPDRSRETVDLLSNGRFELIPDCGHLSTMERPEAVNALLVEWLQS